MPQWGENLRSFDLGASHFLKADAQRSLLKEGLKLNYYIESVGNLYYYPYTNELEYYLDCNRSGRRLLKQFPQRQLQPSSSTKVGRKRTIRGEGTSSNSNMTPVNVPPGIWPHVLARVSRELPLLYSSPQGSNAAMATTTKELANLVQPGRRVFAREIHCEHARLRYCSAARLLLQIICI